MWSHRQPAWSPDGRWLCYRAQRSLWIVSPERRGAHRLTVDEETALDPEWSADGRSIYHTSLREGTAALWKVDVSSGALSRVTMGSGPERHPSVSREGTTLAYSTEMVDRNVVLHDIATGREQLFGTLRSEYMPTFCGTELSVLFASDRVGGRDELWVQPLADSRPVGDARRLTNHPGNVSHPACSPDGRFVAYYRIVEGQRDIWTVPMAGGPPTQFTSDPAADFHPSWSKDGTRLAFVSERSGHQHIWVEPVANGKPAGPAAQVTRGVSPEMGPEWSPDSAWVAYLIQPTVSEADVWVAAADGRGAPRRVTNGAGAYRVRWYQPGRMLVSGSWGGATLSVRAVDPVSGAATALNPPVVLGDDGDMCDFDVSPNHRLLTFARTVRKGNIWKWFGRF
jgi:Tol biopolymer transport system component